MEGERGRWWFPVVLFLGLSVVLGVVVWQSGDRLPTTAPMLSPALEPDTAPGVLGPWAHWDIRSYVRIADEGYAPADVAAFEAGDESLVAFFPAFPMVVRAAAAPLGDTVLAAMLVSWLAGLALAVAFHHWTRILAGPVTAGWATVAILAFPWSYVLFATGYSESFFILCAIGAFVLLEHDRPVAAGLVGAAASASRLVGVAVAICLVIRVLERRGALGREGWKPVIDRSRLRRRDAGVLLSWAGIGSWMTFCWIRYGDPVAFSSAQTAWSQGNGPRSWFKLGFFDQLQHNVDRAFTLRLALQGIVMILFCLAIPAVWRRFGSAYGSYTLIVLLIPWLGSSAFASNARFVLAAFPAFALIGEELACQPRREAALLVGASAFGLLVVASFWGRGYWMA